ncbi:MAG TPA: amylo-alpha-1,6-glucosidase [Candidatus Nitrosopolaris sp.]|nr:amylo-alpha-1,6-glucosidase [Candidatus Nitrosopolaris sp.]
MTRTLDKTHTLLSYIDGSLRNAAIVIGDNKFDGFIFSLLNPPLPLGGNIVSLDIYLDEIPVQKKSIFIATSEDVVNAATLSDDRPISFKPFQTARFLIVKDGGLEEQSKHKIVILSKMEGFEQILVPFTIKDYVSNRRERIFIPSTMIDDTESTTNEDTIFKNFTLPLILSGKKAYIVCSSNGEISAKWSWMGVIYDNGGLFVPPARAFGRIVIEISMDEGVRKRLPNFVVSSKQDRGLLYTRHDFGGLEVKRTLFVPTENKGFVMKLELDLLHKRSSMNFQQLGLEKKTERRFKRKIRVHFLIDGNITSYGLAAISQSNFSKLHTKHNCLQIQTASAKKNLAHYYGTIGVAPKTLRPSRVLRDSFDNDLEISYDVEIEAGKTTELALVATGGFTTSEECLKEFVYIRDNYNQLLESLRNHFDKGIPSSTLNLTPTSSSNHTPGSEQQHQTPTIVKLVKAFEKAKTSLEYLKAEYDELGVGICAGLPRFPNFWARDTGWSLRGYLSMGDYNFVLAIIENFLRHQAKKNSKTALKGELPMIISGKSFLHNTTFGSADSTFLFPWAIREYVFATGNMQFLQKRWKSIIDLVNWGFLKDRDGDGFVEHDFGGVAEKLPIQDSTWMDHIDRRKSANDVQALFYESLKIGSELARIVGDEQNEEKWTKRAEKLQHQIDLEYWDTKSGFYYDTIRKDGSKDSSLRPNSLVLLLTDSVKNRFKADSVLSRIEQNDITTAWGVRTLSSQDPKYHPTLYHDGAVWPLVTGWAALSEVKYGRKEQALFYLESMAERILSENGMYAETYRGDRPQPFNSCILQAWSIGMYVYALREMMLGMNLNMLENKIQFEPQIPESLRNNAVPVDFEFSIPNTTSEDGANRLQVAVDANREKIEIAFRDWNLKTTPEIFSNTYAITIHH